jgi:hypothetical protein
MLRDDDWSWRRSNRTSSLAPRSPKPNLDRLLQSLQSQHKHRFPAPESDCRCAWKYCRVSIAKAHNFGIDVPTFAPEAQKKRDSSPPLYYYFYLETPTRLGLYSTAENGVLERVDTPGC